MTRLSENDYLNVIEKTQIVATDLLICCNGKYLLGKRINNPARGYWFVPGSRAYKDETLEQCIKRTGKIEANLDINIERGRKLGVYYHFYDNNFMNDKFGTNYIVFPFYYEISESEMELVNESEMDE